MRRRLIKLAFLIALILPPHGKASAQEELQGFFRCDVIDTTLVALVDGKVGKFTGRADGIDTNDTIILQYSYSPFHNRITVKNAPQTEKLWMQTKGHAEKIPEDLKRTSLSNWYQFRSVTGDIWMSPNRFTAPHDRVRFGTGEILQGRLGRISS